MSLNEVGRAALAHTKKAGFLDKKRPAAPHIHMLIVTEIAEATEEVRNGRPSWYHENGKPEGECIELADALIRILEHAAWNGWDMEAAVRAKMTYNKGRGYRHGGKTS